jgi:DNA-binding winged helix-turn-helix (wHTH) protein
MIRPAADNSVYVQDDANRVTWGGHECMLTPRQRRLLVALARAFPHVVMREKLVRCVWDGSANGPPDDAHQPLCAVVHLARRRLEAAGCPLRIRASHGAGYRLEAGGWRVQVGRPPPVEESNRPVGLGV